MAVTKAASVKLDLDAGNYAVALKRVGDQTDREGKQAARAFKPLEAGLERVKRDFGDLGGKMKGLMTSAVTLGGALSFGALVHSAAQAQDAYIVAAHALSEFTDQSVSAAEAQAMVERAVEKSGGTFEAARARLLQLAGSHRDVGQVEDALGRSAAQARRLGVEGELIARVYSRLMAKGVAETAEQAERLVDQMNRFGRVTLGIDLDEALDPNDIAEFAAFVKASGSNVEEMTALLSKTGKTAKDLGQALEIVEELGLVLNTRKGLKELRKETGLTAKDINQSKGAVENLFTVLEKGGPRAFKKLQDALGTDRARQAIEELFGEEIAIKIEGGKISKKEFALEVAGLRDALEEQKRVQAKKAGDDRVNADLSETAAAKLRDAINKVETAFQKPQMISAINSLAENLPALADVIAKVVDFAANNPLLAGGIAIGGRAALSFGAGAVSGMGARGGAAAAAGAGAAGAATMGAFGGGGVPERDPRAPGLRTSTVRTPGLAASAAGGAAGAAMKGPGLIARHGAGTVAGAVVAALGAGLTAGTSFFEDMDRMRQRGQAMTAAHRVERKGREVSGEGGSVEEKVKAIQALEMQIRNLEEKKQTGFFEDIGNTVSELMEAVGLEKVRQSAADAAHQEQSDLIKLMEKLTAEVAEKRAKEAEKPERAPVSGEVALKNPDRLGETLGLRMARHIGDRELRVRIVNKVELAEPPGGGSPPPASRGPMGSSDPSQSGGTGGA